MKILKNAHNIILFKKLCSPFEISYNIFKISHNSRPGVKDVMYGKLLLIYKLKLLWSVKITIPAVAYADRGLVAHKLVLFLFQFHKIAVPIGHELPQFDMLFPCHLDKLQLYALNHGLKINCYFVRTLACIHRHFIIHYQSQNLCWVKVGQHFQLLICRREI